MLADRLRVSVVSAVTIARRVVQPHRESLGPHGLFPGIEIGMLVRLLSADPVAVSV